MFTVCSPSLISLSVMSFMLDSLLYASALRVENRGFESHLRRDFSCSSHTSDFKIGTPVATLPALGLVGLVSV